MAVAVAKGANFFGGNGARGRLELELWEHIIMQQLHYWYEHGEQEVQHRRGHYWQEGIEAHGLFRRRDTPWYL